MKKVKRIQRREKRLLTAQLAKQKANEVELEEEPIEDELPDSTEEVTEKDYGEPMMESDMMNMGPKSWDELDAADAAREQADEMSDLAWDTRELVHNILCDPMLDASGKAEAIKAVGDGFGKRVKQVTTAPVEKENDIELLELESIIAKDYRSMSVSERVGDFLNKAVLTAAGEKKLSASDFALPSKRKYPIHDKAHVRNALARAAQQIKAGGAGAADAKAALPAIHAAAKKFGIGVSKENGIIVEKDASGTWRWVGWPTNNFKDRSGDIITEAAQKDYVDWINQDIEKNSPVFTSCHAPGTAREKPVDFAAYENGFVVMSGPLTENEAVALLKTSSKCDIGMSHTGWAWRDSQNPEQIIKYRSFEVTDLPIETADNPFTLLEISKEATVDQLQYLTELLGSKEKAESALKLKTSMKQKELNEAGVESKEGKTETTPEAKPAPVTATSSKDEIVAQVLKELDVEGLQEFLAKANEAMEKVPVLEQLVKNLATQKEDDLAEMINPPAEKRFLWSKARASESKETVIEKEDPLKKSTAGLPDDWLSDALGVQPLATH